MPWDRVRWGAPSAPTWCPGSGTDCLLSDQTPKTSVARGSAPYGSVRVHAASAVPSKQVEVAGECASGDDQRQCRVLDTTSRRLGRGARRAGGKPVGVFALMAAFSAPTLASVWNCLMNRAGAQRMEDQGNRDDAHRERRKHRGHEGELFPCRSPAGSFARGGAFPHATHAWQQRFSEDRVATPPSRLSKPAYMVRGRAASPCVNRVQSR